LFDSRSVATACFVSGDGIDWDVERASRSSIDAGSYFFSVNPSPWAREVSSVALMRSTKRS
jgi:hypothetical protein